MREAGSRLQIGRALPVTTRPCSARNSIGCDVIPMRVTLLYKVAVDHEMRLRIFLIEKKLEQEH